MNAANLIPHWNVVQPIFSIRNERDYDRAVNRLNELLDEVRGNERHPLAGLLDTLGAVIHTYEEQHYPIPEASGVDALKLLMEEHGLHQVDLHDIGSQGVVSEILSGKRDLNSRQIRALAHRFHVSAAVFI
jgi:HTH-type transcriptional regulator/antitoxin HigA